LPAVSASEGIKIDTVTITGKTSSSPLPADADDSWKGVFPTGRNVTLSKYTIGKYEVTVKLWDEVYLWAKENDYAVVYGISDVLELIEILNETSYDDKKKYLSKIL